MTRPITLFTGQWADLTLDTVAQKAAAIGYNGLELACWGDHFDVSKALSDDSYIRSRWDILEKYGLKCFAISTHLVGQAVCDPIDERLLAFVNVRLRWEDRGMQRERGAAEALELVKRVSFSTSEQAFDAAFSNS